MYLKYFGLKEPSFSIAPDPEYLYLSEQHREALAHLLYGAGESGGFVLLTGEVGTGKTTVCRALLEQLPDEVEVALVLNPAMSGAELLRTICEEFHLEVPPRERSTKELIDRLNRYLLDAHAKGRRPVLMIDEAQTLRPRELELVRLLTNLETNKHKLLQIFLVGQPELRRLIDSDALRQLSQRITARFHLGPLTAAETSAYVRHRLAVAGVDRPLFTRRALRRIHTLSGGVPRLINILCDRALLGACVGRVLWANAGIVNRAARELRGQAATRPAPARARPVFVIALALTLLAAGGWLGRDSLSPGVGDELRQWLVARLATESEPQPATAATATPTPTQAPPVDEPIDGAAPMPAVEPRDTVAVSSPTEPDAPVAEAITPASPAALVESATIQTMGLRDAMQVLLRRWDVQLERLESGDPCRRVAEFGLRCERETDGTWGNLRFFDRPALLQLRADGESDALAVLVGLQGDTAILEAAQGRARVPLAELGARWTGDYLLLWQPPPVGTALIGPGSSGEAIRWLRQLLAQAPGLGFSATSSARFDDDLAEALRRFQRGRGLVADGIAGYRTLIQLHNVVGMPGIPRLVEEN